MSDVDGFAATILKTGDDAVNGGLIDSYVAGYHKEKLSEALGFRVGTVFDHQFAYGFVTAGGLAEPEFERCLRRTLSTKESWVTSKIQEEMKALPVSITIVIKIIVMI